MPWIDDALRVLGLNWLSGLVGIGGLVFGVLTYLWSRRRTKLAYVYVGEHLLGSASDALPPAIVVQYNGVSIPRLSKTQVIIWNNGENTISGTDIVPKDPLRLQVGEDGKILSVSVLKTSRDVIDVKLLPISIDHPNEAFITFDYLDAKDGVVIEILHTSTERKPYMKGTLRGLPQGISNYGQFAQPKPQKKSKSKLFRAINVIFSVPVFAGIGFLCAILGPPPDFFLRPENEKLVSAAAGGLTGLLTILAAKRWEARRKYPKSLHMEALE
ncbi:hypothetical protein [Pseudomonas syringae]